MQSVAYSVTLFSLLCLGILFGRDQQHPPNRCPVRRIDHRGKSASKGHNPCDDVPENPGMGSLGQILIPDRSGGSVNHWWSEIMKMSCRLMPRNITWYMPVLLCARPLLGIRYVSPLFNIIKTKKIAFYCKRDQKPVPPILVPHPWFCLRNPRDPMKYPETVLFPPSFLENLLAVNSC